MNLYEIDEAILGCMDEETGEIVDEELLRQLEMEKDTKIENIGLWIKNLDSDADKIAKEIGKLYARQRACQNNSNRLKQYLQGFLAGEKFKSPSLVISYRKSTSVVIEDIGQIPEEYLRYKEPEPKKQEIQKLLKAGKKVPGCSLLEKQNMLIK